MTNKHFRDLIEKFGWTQGEAAKMLFVSLRTVHGYCNGKHIPKRVDVLLRYYDKFGLALATKEK